MPPVARKLHQAVSGDSEAGEHAGALEDTLSPDRDWGFADAYRARRIRALGCGLNTYRGTAWMGTLCKI